MYGHVNNAYEKLSHWSHSRNHSKKLKLIRCCFCLFCREIFVWILSCDLAKSTDKRKGDDIQWFFCWEVINTFFTFNDLYCHWYSQHQMIISLNIWSFKLSLVNYCLVFRLSTNESLWSLFWQLNFYENGRLTTQGGLKLFLASKNNCKRHIILNIFT